VDTEELTLTSRMFECLLSNSDDVFAICSIVPPDAADADGELRVVVTYVSPSVAWRLAFQQADVVGRNLLDVCHPEDRTAFLAALLAAYASASDGHLNYVHRNVSASGGEIWCHTSGLCKGDQLFVVCRDMRTLASVELALRTFTLATSHDVREPCNTILMAVSVLERRPCVAAHEDVSELAETIRSACGLLLGIVGAHARARCLVLPAPNTTSSSQLHARRKRAHDAAGGGGPADGAGGRLQPGRRRRDRAAGVPHRLRRRGGARRHAHHARSRARR
jgi:hypothetical protein